MIYPEPINKILDKYKSEKELYEPLLIYFEGNKAATKYAEICLEKGWDYVIDHMAVRTHSVNSTAKKYEKLGWKYEDKVDYLEEGWWANVYRHSIYPALFIDQSYKDAKKEKIIENWVGKFGEYKFHHIAVLMPEDVGLEEVINLLKKKNENFPGNIIGGKDSRLRQIFTRAELVNNHPYTVLELIQRNKDPNTGTIYQGFINEQADSLMKSTVLKA